MSFITKKWKNEEESTETPISAEALEDLEERLVKYLEEFAEAIGAPKLTKTSNLSDVTSASTARTNLGLGTAATEAKGAFATSSEITTEKSRAEIAEALKLAKASNLSDVASASTARTNLGLGTAATEAKTAFATPTEVTTEKSRAETAEAKKTEGPSSSTESHIAVFSGTSGKVVKDGGKTIAAIETLISEHEGGGGGGASTGEGAPGSLTKGNVYFQTNASEEVVAEWIGTSGSPLKVAEFTGIPGKETVTAAKIGNIGAGTRFWPRGYTYTPGSYKPGEKYAAVVPVYISEPCSITGIQYEVGETKNGKVLVALFNGAGERLGKSVSAEQSAQYEYQRVVFEAKATIIEPAYYWQMLMMESSTGTWWGAANGEPWSIQKEGSFAIPSTIVPPSSILNTGAKAPFLSTY